MTINELPRITPESIRDRTDAELLVIQGHDGPNTPWGRWATAEIARRQSVALTEATQSVHREVSRLASSSERLEGLTNRLNMLTWVLVGLTAVAILTPIGLEIWTKNERDINAPVPPIVVQFPQPRAPQMPPRPAP